MTSHSDSSSVNKEDLHNLHTSTSGIQLKFIYLFIYFNLVFKTGFVDQTAFKPNVYQIQSLDQRRNINAP